MKTLFTILFVVAILVYSSQPKINFKPFSIDFEKPYIPFAIFFLVLSISLFQLQQSKTSHKEGYKDGVEDMANEIKKQIREL